MTTGESNLACNNGAKQWKKVGAEKERDPPGTQDDSSGKDLESISRRNQAH